MAFSIRSNNVERVARAVYQEPHEREAFLCALESGQSGITAVAWLRSAPVEGLYEKHQIRPAWLPEWIEVAAESSQPGKLPQHDSGEFYLLDLSSTFAVAPLAETETHRACIVDMCAAPGGKGILAWRYCMPGILVGNEVIRKRTAQLISNYSRCAIDPAMVTSCDPGLLGSLLPGRAQIVIVDAPCSGQSLLVKGLSAPSAFHPATISMNERRQRRILAHSAAIVSPGGYLLYATCTFSPEENEKNVEWFCKTFPHFKTVAVPALEQYRSHLSHLNTYRLAPQQGVGAGAFCALLVREGALSEAGGCDPTEMPMLVRPVWTSSSLVGCEQLSLPTYGDHSRDGRPRQKGRQDKHRRRWGRRDRD
jgi:16S rRNA C967 or C1407 C5-methylase (RsmB/RsmF family)